MISEEQIETSWLWSDAFPLPHLPRCLIYRYAEALIGRDRRGLCDCGAEPEGVWCPVPQDHSRYIHEIYPRSLFR